MSSEKIKKIINKHPVVYYPVLLILLFVLTKIQISEVNPDLRKIILFMSMNIAGMYAFYAFLLAIIRDRLKAWMVVTLLFSVLLFFAKLKAPFSKVLIYYKIHFSVSKVHFLDIIRDFVIEHMDLVLTIVFSLLLVLIAYLILKYRRPLIRLNQYLNLLLVFLVIYQLYTISTQNTNKIKFASVPDMISDKNAEIKEPLPDIYYIILDGYTSSNSLKNYWGFDNNEFMEFLKSEGFYIATESKSNYNQTPYSLASSLNMTYLRNIPNSAATSAQEKNLFNLVDSSLVISTFIKNKYHVYNLSSFSFPGIQNFYKDAFFLLKKRLLAGTFYDVAAKNLVRNWNWRQDKSLLDLKEVNVKILDSLCVKKDSATSKPIFYYAHIMMPHEPYFYNESGQVMEADSALNYLSKNRYLGQLKYLNKLIKNTITSILGKYDYRMPVIIIQGDHGWRYLGGKERIKESGTILNAYLFPDHDYSKLYPSISPVNSFRILFNKYFNTRLAILPDTTYNVFIF